MRLVTNTNKQHDRMYKLLSDQGHNAQVFIASAFFSDAQLALEMVKNNCTILLIVRLDYGTNPEALKKIYNNQNIEIRFYTGTYFHPKFYIFGNDIAYLGSANFTHSGLTTNNEVNIEFDSEEPIFDDLKATFWEYWNQAEVLTKEKLDKFANVINECNVLEPSQAIRKIIGSYEYNNVGREPQKGNTKDIFISSFRRSYQLYISSFNKLKQIYQMTNIRRYPNVPLRIEIDRFLWWIREDYARGDSYKNIPKKTPNEIETSIIPYIIEFENVKNKYLDSSANTRYIEISNGFSDIENIKKMDFEDIFTILDHVYAFHDTFRFFVGGHETMKASFKSENELDRIKNLVIYLIFGKDEHEERIFNCIFDEKYKLKGFGESCVKELYGIINSNEIPICNGRTLKSMQWLGFGKL